MKRWSWIVVMVLGYDGLWRLSEVENEGTAFQAMPYVGFILFSACMLLLWPRNWEE